MSMREAPLPRFLNRSLETVFAAICLSLVATLGAEAGSATWNSNPATSDWNTATNWTPPTVPEQDADTATFGVSNTTSILNSNKLEIAGINFVPGASTYTITWITQRSVMLVGNGVTNNSGVTQNFIVGNSMGPKQATLTFAGAANAGSMTSYTNYGFAGSITFQDESSAGSAALVNSVSNSAGEGGLIQFTGSSTADHASFVNSANSSSAVPGQINFFDSAQAGFATFANPGGMPLGHGGLIQFYGTATAGHGVFTCEGGEGTDAPGALLWIYDGASAGNASFAANGGQTEGARGSEIYLTTGADAGDATFAINGGQAAGALGGIVGCGAINGNATFLVNGATVSGATGATLLASGLENATIVVNPSANGGGPAQVQVSGPTVGAEIKLLGDGALFVRSLAVSVGSIEGDGPISIGRNNLSIGSNNLSTTLSGTITGGNDGRGGILTKIGTGTLTLTGANTYPGGTVVEAGILLANNTVGSGTGTNTVQVNGGTFGGGGKVSGRVIVGTGSGPGAILGPGARGVVPGTLTIKSNLTLMSDATYKCTLDSRTNSADQAKAKGVTIQGAQILFDDRSNTVLTAGTVFTVVSNTSRAPITGTFSNLPDGSTVTIGNNTFQANYEGGDGNDLTLTVVP